MQAAFLNEDVEGASLWFDGKQLWMDRDWRIGEVSHSCPVVAVYKVNSSLNLSGMWRLVRNGQSCGRTRRLNSSQTMWYVAHGHKRAIL